MKAAAVFAAVALVDAAQAVAYTDLFEDFIVKHKPSYGSEAEKAARFEIFVANMKFVEETNAKQSSYTLGMTPFSDLTFEEFRAKYVGGMTSLGMQNATKFEAPANFVAQASLDWVATGAVTPVKNQGTCGSCWTFSTTGALEGAMAVAGRQLVSLSEQELVSCDSGVMGGHGCQGGNPHQALGWVKSNGICGEESSPYQCMDPTSSQCRGAACLKGRCTTILRAGGWFHSGDVSEVYSVGHSESDLEAAVAQVPVSVAIEADQRAFQMYTGGVLTSDACGQTLDHAVLAVGYGADWRGQEYWKVKNSWGASWGEAGYVRIARGKSGEGECGIRGMAAYATVKAAENIVV